jgi:hypothetical protein
MKKKRERKSGRIKYKLIDKTTGIVGGLTYTKKDAVKLQKRYGFAIHTIPRERRKLSREFL